MKTNKKSEIKQSRVPYERVVEIQAQLKSYNKFVESIQKMRQSGHKPTVIGERQKIKLNLTEDQINLVKSQNKE